MHQQTGIPARPRFCLTCSMIPEVTGLCLEGCSLTEVVGWASVFLFSFLFILQPTLLPPSMLQVSAVGHSFIHSLPGSNESIPRTRTQRCCSALGYHGVVQQLQGISAQKSGFLTRHVGWDVVRHDGPTAFLRKTNDGIGARFRAKSLLRAEDNNGGVFLRRLSWGEASLRFLPSNHHKLSHLPENHITNHHGKLRSAHSTRKSPRDINLRRRSKGGGQIPVRFQEFGLG